MEVASNAATRDVNTAAETMAVSEHISSAHRLTLMIGAWLGVIGAIFAAVANGLHPHPNDFRLEALLQEIAQNAAWSTVHMTLILSLVLILGALVAITLTTKEGSGAIVSRFACMAALLGGALIFVSTAMDGFAMNQLARAWLDAPPDEKASALRIASAFEDAGYAIYSLSIVIFLGIGIFLYGLSTVLSSDYPKALGWLAMLSGAGEFIVGVSQAFGGPELRTTEVFSVLFSVLSTIWVLIMGVVMWRKAVGGNTNGAAPVSQSEKLLTGY